MDGIQTIIQSFASSHQGSPNVAIIDDEFEQIDIPSLAAWTELKQALQQNPAIEEVIIDRLESLGHNPTDPAPKDLLKDSFKEIDLSANAEMQTALKKYLGTEHFLILLESYFKKLGFEVQRFSAKPKFTGEELPFLILVDYQLYPEAESGKTALTIFQDLMETCAKSSKSPPFVILMSKGVDEKDTWIWMGLAERSGFFRFNFEFLHKEAFNRNPTALSFILSTFLRYQGVSRAYFEQMEALRRETFNIASTVVRRLFQVTPPECEIFRSRMQTEGSSLASAFTVLYGDHLLKGISESLSVQQSTAALENAIAKEGLPVAQVEQCGKLHQLYADLLHQAPLAQSGNSPQFGDIFQNGNKFYLIISQDCDLLFGDHRAVKVDRVLAIEGTIRYRDATTDDGPVITKPFSSDPDGETSWMWWQLAKPIVISYNDFAGAMKPIEEPFLEAAPLYRKRYRLRFADADQIQQAFASHLTRVATEVHPHPIRRCEARLQDEGRASTTVVRLYIFQHDEEQFAAIEPSSRMHFLRVGATDFMSSGLILRLSRFHTLKDFRTQLHSEGIFPGEEDGKLFLIKYTKRPRGISEWKGIS